MGNNLLEIPREIDGIKIDLPNPKISATISHHLTQTKKDSIMNKEEFIKKAKELGLSIDEIDQFIRNQEIAQNYGIDDEYSTVNFTIDKSLAEEEEENNTSTTQENHSHECHCCSEGEHECCHCHECNHEHCECECDHHSECGNNCECNHCHCDHCKHN